MPPWPLQHGHLCTHALCLPTGYLALGPGLHSGYKAAAHVLVDTAGRSPSQAATAVLIATGWDAP